MIPKKIYLNPKTLAGLSPTNGEGKTMRVKTFASKNDVEYINTSQLWHPADERPKTAVNLLIMFKRDAFAFGNFEVGFYLDVLRYHPFSGPGFYRAFDCAKIPDHEVLAWLYLIDIPTTK